jgi:choline-sulfatase
MDGGYHVMGIGHVGAIKNDLHEMCFVADVGALEHPACAFLQHMQRRGLAERVYRQRQQRLRTGPFEMDPAGLNAPTDDVDGFIAQQATMAIERLPDDRPWCLIVAFTGPGNDLPAPPCFIRQVTSNRLGDGFAPADMRTIDHYAQVQHPRTLLQRMGPATIANIRRHYLARVAQLDNAIGMLREAIDRRGMARRTWVNLVSDHGKLLGERGLVGHRSMLGPAVYVPMVFLPPAGKPHGELAQEQQLVSTTDFGATIARLGQVDPPRGSIGRSLLPMLGGEVVGGAGEISEFSSWLMLETLQHRVVFDTDHEEPLSLFDLLKDANERNDLIGTMEGSAVIDMLRWQLAGSLMRLRPVRAA